MTIPEGIEWVAKQHAWVREKARIKYLTGALFGDGEAIITLDYEGYENSGGVDHCSVNDVLVQDMLMYYMNIEHAGWENGEGAFGTITWNLRTDVITVNHDQRVMSYISSTTEVEPGVYKDKLSSEETL